jgi:hypothetical protein
MLRKALVRVAKRRQQPERYVQFFGIIFIKIFPKSLALIKNCL